MNIRSIRALVELFNNLISYFIFDLRSPAQSLTGFFVIFNDYLYLRLELNKVQCRYTLSTLENPQCRYILLHDNTEASLVDQGFSSFFQRGAY